MEQIKPNLFIKKTKDSYRIVYPIKKDLEKGYSLDNIHWKNLLIGGSWSNLRSTSIIIILLLFLTWSYAHDTKACREMMENFNQYCDIHQQTYNEGFNIQEYNFSNIKDGDVDIPILP